MLKFSEKCKRELREAVSVRESVAKSLADRDAALLAEQQMRLSYAALKVELDQLRVRLAHASSTAAGVKKRARSRENDDVVENDNSVGATDDGDSTATSTVSTSVLPSSVALSGTAVRVCSAPELDGVVVAVCGNSRGRFDFVKLDGLQLQYGSTIADVHQHRVRDLKLLGALPAGPFAEKMILSAGGRALQLTSLRSNSIALTIHAPSHAWSCVSLAEFGLPTVLACGVQDGSVALYDVRMPQSMMLQLAAAGSGRGQPLFALAAVYATDTSAPWLIGVSAGRLSSWQLAKNGDSLQQVCSFAPVAWPDDRKCRNGAVANTALLTSHQVGESITEARYEHRLMQGFSPNSWPPNCETVLSSASSVCAMGGDGESIAVCSDAIGGVGNDFALLRVERGRMTGRIELKQATGSGVVDMHVSVSSTARWITAIGSNGLSLWRLGR